MSKFVYLFSILTISSSLAAPLMGTKQSVNESSFCKKYKCVFVSSSTPEYARSLPDAKGHKEFIYKLSGEGQLKVIRDASNVIISTGIYFEGMDKFKWAWNSNGTYSKDFAVSFLGTSPSKSLKDACLMDLRTADFPMTGGIMGASGKYVMRCIASLEGENGTPAMTAIIMSIGLK